MNPMYTFQHQEEVQYDLDKPRIAVYKNTWKRHQNSVCWCNLKLAQRKGCSSIKHDLTQSLLFNTLRAICIEKNGIHEGWRRLAQQSTLNLRGYREQPYSRRICIMDVRIFLIPKREHPPTIKANEARSTRRLVARSSRRLEAAT